MSHVKTPGWFGHHLNHKTEITNNMNKTNIETDTASGNAPKVGQRVTIRGVLCEIIKIRPFGTIDVAALNPDDSRAFRVTGLNFTI